MARRDGAHRDTFLRCWTELTEPVEHAGAARAPQASFITLTQIPMRRPICRAFALLSLTTSLACRGDSAPPKAASGRTAAPTATASPSTAAKDACATVASFAYRLPGARVKEEIDSFPAFTGAARRHGCVVDVTGPLSRETPVPVAATSLPDSLGADWRRDDAIVADGPTQTVYGLWRANVLCLVRVRWAAPERADSPREAGRRYTAVIGCEELPDRVVPRR
jgi:hypothetical protein